MAGEYWLAMRADGFKGQGTAADPWDVSGPTLFNTVMKNIAALNPQGQVCIHIGPGIFQVPAFSDVTADGWGVLSFWRIVGAGMHATVLKLVNPKPGLLHWAIVNADSHHKGAEGVIIEDFTIDCNMRGYKDLGVAMGGINLRCARSRIRRVRIITAVR